MKEQIRMAELREKRDEFILNESVFKDDNPSWGEVADAQAEAERRWNETDEGRELSALIKSAGVTICVDNVGADILHNQYLALVEFIDEELHPEVTDHDREQITGLCELLETIFTENREDFPMAGNPECTCETCTKDAADATA